MRPAITLWIYIQRKRYQCMSMLFKICVLSMLTCIYVYYEDIGRVYHTLSNWSYGTLCATMWVLRISTSLVLWKSSKRL